MQTRDTSVIIVIIYTIDHGIRTPLIPGITYIKSREIADARFVAANTLIQSFPLTLFAPPNYSKWNVATVETPPIALVAVKFCQIQILRFTSEDIWIGLIAPDNPSIILYTP